MKYKVNVEKLERYCEENNVKLVRTLYTLYIELSKGLSVVFNTNPSCYNTYGEKGSGFVYYGADVEEIRCMSEEDECIDEAADFDIIIDLYNYGAIEDTLEFKIGDKVSVIGKSEGMNFETWKKMNSSVCKFLKENGFLYISDIRGKRFTLGTGASGRGDHFSIEDLIPYQDSTEEQEWLSVTELDWENDKKYKTKTNGYWEIESGDLISFQDSVCVYAEEIYSAREISEMRFKEFDPNQEHINSLKELIKSQQESVEACENYVNEAKKELEASNNLMESYKAELKELEG